MSEEGATASGLATDAEVAELVETTRFTKKEVHAMYKHSMGAPHANGIINEATFRQMCEENSLTSSDLQDRLWDVFDITDNGTVTVKELIETLNTLTKGTLEDVTRLFFRMYDVNHDGSVTLDEVMEVFNDLISVTSGVKAAGLNEKQKSKLREFVTAADADADDDLDYEEFAAAVRHLASLEDQPTGFLTARNMWLTFVTSWFEVGTSFACVATSALAVEMQYRMDTDDAGIGSLVSAYFLGSMFGPSLFGGPLLNKIGAIKVIIMANVIVTLSCVLQCVCEGSDMMWLLLIARFGVGFGGLCTPFTTMEVLLALFPDDFMLMCGIRNLVQSASGFVTFILLPAVHQAFLDDASLEDGSLATMQADPDYAFATVMALGVCVVGGMMSLATNLYIYFGYMMAELPPPITLGSQIRGFAGAITPVSPNCADKWKLPVGFYVCLFGIISEYFAPFMFTAYSNKIYMLRHGASASAASFYSGVMNLFGGLLGPVFGPMSDKYGQRGAMLAGFGLFQMVGFLLLATTTVTPWVATVLFSVTYGFGDTVAYPNIRSIVGAEKAGLGYGVYSIFGGCVAVMMPIAGGFFMAMDDPDKPEETGVYVCFFFAGASLLASGCWLACHFLEGPKAFIALPASELVETEESHIDAAALIGAKKSNPILVEIEDEFT
jgi:MFS family permease/Ca2+-binding EF-hand superfamily protein